MRIERMFVDAFLLCPPPPRLWYCWIGETLSFLHVLLVWGVNLANLLNKWR